MPRPLRTACAALLALALLPAAAQAAFAPKLTASLSPSTAGGTPRIVTDVTQMPGETANRTVVVSIPKGFGVPPGLITFPVCTPDQVNARACPANARIGSVNGVANVSGLPVPADGGVFWGGPQGDGTFAIYGFLDNDGLNQHITVKGVIAFVSAGGFSTTFDGLPNILTTSLKLTFDGGPAAILTAPKTCGDFTLGAAFTSQSGEHATSQATVAITDCGPPPVVLSKVRVGRGTRRKVSYTLSAAAKLRVLLKGPNDDAKRVDRTIDAAAGTHAVRLPALKPGIYRLALTAVGAEGTPTTKKASITVRSRKRR